MATMTRPSAKIGEAMMELRERTPARGSQRASFELPSNRQAS